MLFLPAHWIHLPPRHLVIVSADGARPAGVSEVLQQPLPGTHLAFRTEMATGLEHPGSRVGRLPCPVAELLRWVYMGRLLLGQSRSWVHVGGLRGRVEDDPWDIGLSRQDTARVVITRRRETFGLVGIKILVLGFWSGPGPR